MPKQARRNHRRRIRPRPRRRRRPRPARQRGRHDRWGHRCHQARPTHHTGVDPATGTVRRHGRDDTHGGARQWRPPRRRPYAAPSTTTLGAPALRQPRPRPSAHLRHPCQGVHRALPQRPPRVSPDREWRPGQARPPPPRRARRSSARTHHRAWRREGTCKGCKAPISDSRRCSLFMPASQRSVCVARAAWYSPTSGCGSTRKRSSCRACHVASATSSGSSARRD